MEVTYNCWHGCHKKSEGCKNCYVHRRDDSIGKDADLVVCNKDINLPVRKDRYGNYKYPEGTSFMTCFSSDFFIEEADEWREEVLRYMKERSDCTFFLITKRPERIALCLNPKDYPNLSIACTMENQKRFDERFPIYTALDMNYYGIMIEPMLEDINFNGYDLSKINIITVGGESGYNARTLNFDWVRKIYDMCKEKGIRFYFHQTGAKLLKDGKLYNIERKYQHSQAKKAFKVQEDR